MRRVFAWAYLQGFASYLVSLYWIPIPLHDFADVRMTFAIVPMLLLAGIVAIYAAAAIWAGEFVARRTRIPFVLTMPVAWTAVEWIRTYVPIGFPWNLLGYAAYRNLELIQFAEFTGVYGVSALIVFFNAVVYVVIFRRGVYRLQTISLSALTAIMIALVGFGAWRISNLKNAPHTGSFKVAMVQGNIPQSLKWDPKFLPESYKVYQDETAERGQARRRPHRLARGSGGVPVPARRSISRRARKRRSVSHRAAHARAQYRRAGIVRSTGAGTPGRAPGILQSRVPGVGQGRSGRALRQDRAGAIRRVRSGPLDPRLLRQPGRGGLRRFGSRHKSRRCSTSKARNSES